MPDDTQPTNAELDQEFAYTTWRDSCRSVVSNNRACRRPIGHTGDHASGYGSERMTWPRAHEHPKGKSECGLCGDYRKLVRFGDAEIHMWLCERCNRGDL